MAGPKPKKYTVDGRDYFILSTGTDEGGIGLADVTCDGTTHRNLMGTNWREFVDSFQTVSRKGKS